MLDLLPRDQWQYGVKDVLRSVAAAFAGRGRNEQLSLPELGKCIPARSGRAALLAAIKALNLPLGAKIGVPLYCCPIVFRAIVLGGCTPRFIDVDETTLCMSVQDLAAKNSELDAVIAVHTLGNICDVPRLQAVAVDKPFIEDCAQSLGSRLAGRMTGSFGAVSIFSFRSGKYLSVGEGGALFSNSASTCLKAEEFISAWPVPTLGEELVHIIKIYLKSLLRSRPLYGMIGYRLWQNLNEQFKLSERSDVVVGKIYRTDLALTKARLPLLNATIAAHRANSDSYSHNLTLSPEMLSSEPSGAFYNRLHYPIILPSQKYRDTMADYLLKQGIDTTKYLDDIIEIAKKTYGYMGSCPVSERLSKRVLLLPNYSGLRPRDVEHIIKWVNAKWAQVQGENGTAGNCARILANEQTNAQHDRENLASLPRGHGMEASEEVR